MADIYHIRNNLRINLLATEAERDAIEALYALGNPNGGFENLEDAEAVAAAVRALGYEAEVYALPLSEMGEYMRRVREAK